MKAHRRLIRALRALALSGCLCAAAAVPATAAANGQRSPGFSSPNPVATLAAAKAAAHPRQFTLPSDFTTSTQGARSKPVQQFRSSSPVAAAAAARAFAEHSQQSSNAASQPSSGGNDDETLAIALASAALAIALGGAAYASTRTTRVQRRALGSSGS
ncbi:MAG TPA: hypothetical protein VGI67_06795 [Thermoleophilaceae bacterium]|jgi:hypothetical protein